MLWRKEYAVYYGVGLTCFRCRRRLCDGDPVKVMPYYYHWGSGRIKPFRVYHIVCPDQQQTELELHYG